ncbi:mCG1038205, partial [Mus musculus]
HYNCQTKAGKRQSWRPVGLARPGKVGEAFSSSYRSKTVPNWQLRELQSCRPDPGVHRGHYICLMVTVYLPWA